MAKEIKPQETTRAAAYELWMKAPNPMVTFFKTLDVTNLVRTSKKKQMKFNMLLDFCIGKAAATIKEFSIRGGKVYLSPIINCFDGMPVAWSIGTSPNAELSNSMLRMAVSTLKPDEKPIVHSDRGCHYRWPEWISIIEEAGLIRSMSKKGCSPDNAACEGFFGHLKTEMFYNTNWGNVSIEEFIQEVDQYLHWYREDRIKLSLGGLSPINYRRRMGVAV